MCDLCEEGITCPDCNRMICFDVKVGDDIIRPAYITEAGDLRCNACGLGYDQVDDEDYYPGPWDD